MKIREKQTNFIDLIKAFWVADKNETSFEEELSADNSGLSEEDINLLTKESNYIKDLEKAISTHEVKKSKRKPKNNPKEIISNEIVTNKIAIEEQEHTSKAKIDKERE